MSDRLALQVETRLNGTAAEEFAHIRSTQTSESSPRTTLSAELQYFSANRSCAHAEPRTRPRGVFTHSMNASFSRGRMFRHGVTNAQPEASVRLASQ